MPVLGVTVSSQYLMAARMYGFDVIQIPFPARFLGKSVQEQRLLSCLAGVLVQAQTTWSNTVIHPWGTSLRCSGTTLVATVSSQPVACLYASGASSGTQVTS